MENGRKEMQWKIIYYSFASTPQKLLLTPHSPSSRLIPGISSSTFNSFFLQINNFKQNVGDDCGGLAGHVLGQLLFFIPEFP